MIQSERSNDYLYPVNLIIDLEETRHPDMSHHFNPEKLPKDFEASVHYVMSTLHPLESSIIRSLYWTGHKNDAPTIVELAENLQLSPFHVNARFQSAIDKLSSPDAWGILTRRVSGYISFLKCKMEQPEAIAEETVVENEKKNELDRFKEITIEALDLPSREYSLLKQAGYKTVAEILEAGPRKIRSIRNCGVKAFMLIMRSLEKKGADISGWIGWKNEKQSVKDCEII